MASAAFDRQLGFDLRRQGHGFGGCAAVQQAELDIGGAGGIRVCNGADHKLDLRCCRTRFRPGRSRRQPESDAHSATIRSEEHTSELQSLMRISYAVFCLKKKKHKKSTHTKEHYTTNNKTTRVSTNN